MNVFRPRSHSAHSAASLTRNFLNTIQRNEAPPTQPPPPQAQPVNPIEVDVIEVIERDPQFEEDWDYDPSPHLPFMENHPLGAVLLKLAQECVNISEKNNKKSMTFDINDLANQFYEGIRIERANTTEKLSHTVETVEQALLNKELSVHTINSAVEPPTNFSPIPVITSLQKLVEIQKIFPKPGKFSGNLSVDGNYSVIHFLNALKSAQEICKLSESEFIDRMLASTTGHAYDLILDWKTNGDKASTIFYSLVINFDMRMPCEEAKQRLSTFTVYRNSNLARAQSNIQSLVERAASFFPPGNARSSYRDMEGCLSLIKSLPQYSSLQASNLYNSYTARMGRACTMQELFRGLDQYRSVIDKDIKEHAPLPPNTYNKRFTPKPQKPIAFKRQPKFGTYLTALENVASTGPRLVQSPQNAAVRPPNRPNNPQRSNNMTPRPNNQTPAAAYNSYNNTNNYRGSNNFRNARNFQNKRPMLAKCTFCGQKPHNQVGCPHMINPATGKPVTILPTYGVCGKCPAFIRPRLRHPENICPYRVGGPLHIKRERN